MQENFERYLSEVLKRPEAVFVSLKKEINASNIYKFEQFFSELEENYSKSSAKDKISSLLLAAALANYYYEIEKNTNSESNKEAVFTDKMRNLHQALCSDNENSLSDTDKAKLSALVGYVGICVQYFLLATFFYAKAIDFEKKSLSQDTAKNLTNYYLGLSLAYFKNGSIASKNLSFKAESEIYDKAINAAKDAIAQNKDDKKSEAWFYVTRATYSLAILHYQQKSWDQATRLLNDVILASLSGLKIETNSEKQTEVFLKYITNSLELIPGLLKQNSIQNSSRQAIKEAILNLNMALSSLPQKGALLAQVKEKVGEVESSLLSSSACYNQFWGTTLSSAPLVEKKDANILPVKTFPNT